MLNRLVKTRTTLVMTFPDGQEHHVEYQPVLTSDPAILNRLASTGRPGGPEVLTTFRALRERPAAYPAGVPFVKGIKTHTNEFPGSEQPPRARWAVRRRPDRVIAEVVRQSIESDWQLDHTITLPSSARPNRTVFLRRGKHVRRVSMHNLAWLWSLVELEDIPAEAARRFQPS